MPILIAAAFLAITAFALRRGSVGAMGIFMIYMWTAVLIPYFAPNLFGFPIESYVVPIESDYTNTAILLVILFLLLCSISDMRVAPIGDFVQKYAIGPSQKLSNTFSIISMAFVSVFLAISIYSMGGIEAVFTAFYKRVIVENSVFNFSSILLFFGLSFSVFAFRFRQRINLALLVSMSLCVFCAFLSGGRAVAILYLVALVYGDFVRMGPVKMFVSGVGALLAITLISSTMLSARFEAQSGPLRNSKATVIETAVNGIVVIDEIALAVQYAEVKRVDMADVYWPIISLPVPRALWGEKPIQISRKLREFRFGDTSGGVPPSLVGESYLAGGAIMVAVMGVLFGLALGIIDRISSLAKRQRFPAAEAVGGILGPTMAFIVFRGGLDIGVMRVLVPLVACWLALRTVRRYVTRERNRAAYRHEFLQSQPKNAP